MLALENPMLALENPMLALENPRLALENPRLALENPRLALESLRTLKYTTIELPRTRSTRNLVSCFSGSCLERIAPEANPPQAY